LFVICKKIFAQKSQKEKPLGKKEAKCGILPPFNQSEKSPPPHRFTRKN